mmetsp:Transcript_31599/g.92442  ORF Transcript_31599/g.92442 Transcript_31599/m.92442 type:complete len:202 (-) Transcript_31599:157-762(-)
MACAVSRPRWMSSKAPSHSGMSPPLCSLFRAALIKSKTSNFAPSICGVMTMSGAPSMCRLASGSASSALPPSPSNAPSSGGTLSSTVIALHNLPSFFMSILVSLEYMSTERWVPKGWISSMMVLTNFKISAGFTLRACLLAQILAVSLRMRLACLFGMPGTKWGLCVSRSVSTRMSSSGLSFLSSTSMICCKFTRSFSWLR